MHVALCSVLWIKKSQITSNITIISLKPYQRPTDTETEYTRLRFRQLSLMAINKIQTISNPPVSDHKQQIYNFNEALSKTYTETQCTRMQF